MSFDQRQEVERELGVSFADIYNTLDGLHLEVRDLERIFKEIFEGRGDGTAL